jgi:transposase InsO family protein
MRSSNKSVLARELGVSRGSLYYESKQEIKDWRTKILIEETLRNNPSYGHKRLAIHLKMNKKQVLRVMKLYGIKPYRRHGKKYKKTKNIKVIYPNLLLTEYPRYENHIWASDFTYLKIGKKNVYVCTVMDLYTKKIIGLSILTNHTVQLTINALMQALNNHPRPEIFHSDNGREYDAKDFRNILMNLGIQISRSAPGCPWENGYQESFYDKFKIELGDPNRFHSLGELTFEIYQQIHYYNHNRIHTALKCSPVQFALRQKSDTIFNV